MDAQSGLIPLIRAHPIFAPLGEDVIAEFVGQGRKQPIAAGETLVRQGDASDSAFILLEGAADVFVETNFGQAMETALQLAKSGDADYLPGWCGPAPED